MSKIYDIEKMYGQDFNMVTTNGPSNIIRKSKNLLPNTFLISSPEDTKGGQDNNFPSLFVTDYTGEPLQLTYPLLMKYGLNYNSSLGCAFINIDNSTIVTEDSNGRGPLMVNTNNLSLANTKRRGTVKVSEDIQLLNRNLEDVNEKYNTKTFIKINNNGVLYIDNSFIDLIDNLVNLKIKSKLDSIKLMVNNNLKMWINVKLVNSNKINLIYNINSSIDSIDLSKIGDYSYSVDEVEYVSKNSPIIMFFDLHYYSFNNESENISIKYDNIPNIYSIDFSNSNMTTVNPIPNNDELYEHVLENIRIIFLPNYFLNNNKSILQSNNLLFSVDNVEYGKIGFTQNPLSTINNMEINNIPTETNNNNDKNINIHILNNPFKLCNIKEGDSTINLFNYSLVGYFEGENSSKSTEYIKNLDDILNDSGNIEIELVSSIDFSKFLKNECYSDIDGANPSINTKSNYVYSKIGEDGTTIINYIKFVVEFIIKSKNKTISSWKESYDINLNLDSNDTKILMNINTNNINNSSPKRLMRSISLMSSTGNSTSIEANNYNIPNHFYYDLRSNNGRMYLNNQYEYNGEDINPDVLYCIIKDDMVYSDDNYNNALFKIKNSGYKLVKYEGDKIINDSIDYSLIKLDYDSYTKIEDGYIEFDLGKNNSDRIRNNNMLLSNGLSIPVKTKSNNKATQTLQINVNILELLLNNTFIKQKYNNSLEKLSGPQYISNELNYNNKLYYNMNNYVITDSINNNEIEYIKFIVPYYVINSLSNDNYMNITFGFSDKSGVINESIIQIKKSNGQINSVILNNLKDNILSLENSQFDIDFEDKNNNYIILKHKNSKKLLFKLLFIKFNFSFNDDIIYKICYITDTNEIPSNGAELKLIENSEKAKTTKLYYNESNKLYDIIYTSNTRDNIDINKILNPKVTQNGIIVEDLILNSDAIYNYTNDNIEAENDSNFNIYINENELTHFNEELDIKANFNYKKANYDNCYDYKTYVNTNNDENIDKKLPYKIRFNKYSLLPYDTNLDENNIYKYLLNDNNNLYNFSPIEILANKSSLEWISSYINKNYKLYHNIHYNKIVNNNEVTNQEIGEEINTNYINYINDNTGEKLNNNSIITRNDNIGLYINNIISNNNLINNLSLNNNIRYTKITWGGLVSGNTTISDSGIMYMLHVRKVESITSKPLMVDGEEININVKDIINNTNVLCVDINDPNSLTNRINTTDINGSKIYTDNNHNYIGINDFFEEYYSQWLSNVDYEIGDIELYLYNPTMIPNSSKILDLQRKIRYIFSTNTVITYPQSKIYLVNKDNIDNIYEDIDENDYIICNKKEKNNTITYDPTYPTTDNFDKYYPNKTIFFINDIVKDIDILLNSIVPVQFYNNTNTESPGELQILNKTSVKRYQNNTFKKDETGTASYKGLTLLKFSMLNDNEKIKISIQKQDNINYGANFTLDVKYLTLNWYDGTKYVEEIDIESKEDKLPIFTVINDNVINLSITISFGTPNENNNNNMFIYKEGDNEGLFWKEGQFPTSSTLEGNPLKVSMNVTINFGEKTKTIERILKINVNLPNEQIPEDPSTPSIDPPIDNGNTEGDDTNGENNNSNER